MNFSTGSDPSATFPGTANTSASCSPPDRAARSSTRASRSPCRSRPRRPISSPREPRRSRTATGVPFLIENLTYYLPDLPADPGWDEVVFLTVEISELLRVRPAARPLQLPLQRRQFRIRPVRCPFEAAARSRGRVHLAGVRPTTGSCSTCTATRFPSRSGTCSPGLPLVRRTSLGWSTNSWNERSSSSARMGSPGSSRGFIRSGTGALHADRMVPSMSLLDFQTAARITGCREGRLASPERRPSGVTRSPDAVVHRTRMDHSAGRHARIRGDLLHPALVATDPNTLDRPTDARRGSGPSCPLPPSRRISMP